MKSKSLCAGVLGVLLFFAGQGLPARAEPLPEPDRESSAIPDPDGKTLPAPDREASIIPGPPNRKTQAAPGPGQTTALAPPPQRAAGTGGRQEQPAASGVPDRPAAAPVPERAAAVSAVSEPRPPRNPPDRGLFLGAMAGLRVLSYDTDGTDWERIEIDGSPTYSGGLFFGADFGRVIAQAEVLFSGDRGTIENMGGFDDLSGISLLIPLIVKGDFLLGPVVLQPLAGLYFNVALGDLTLGGSMGGEEPYASPPIGLMAGGDLGIRFGRNRVFLDLRYALDLGKTAVGNNPMTAWRRSAFMLNLGYQFYIWRKT